MSPEAARLYFVAGLTFLAGGVGGVLATRALYGETPDVNPTPPDQQKSDCAPCPQCPVCPEPVDCGELGVIPQNDPTIGGDLADPGAVEAERPGLPASALPIAMKAVRTSIETCMAGETGMSGMVLLELTAVASATTGSINAVITRTTGDVENTEVAECIRGAAEQATFAWDGPEGELKFKLPVKVGR